MLKNRLSCFIHIIIIGMILFIACKQDVQATSEHGVLRLAHIYAWGGEESLDPASSKRFIPAILMLYERLVRLDKDRNPCPDLAESWESDSTSRKFTFHLRRNVRFHNGKPLTAKDVVYTFKHILNPDVGSPAASALNIIDAEAFETPNEHTVVFNLRKPHADFPLLLTHNQIRIISEGSAPTIGKTGIGTGPFKLAKLDVKGTTVLAANDDYHGGQPGLKRIDIVRIADKNAQVYAMLDDLIDSVSSISSVQAQLFEENKEFTVQELPNGLMHTLVMNTTVAPFNDVRVRKAMKYVVDRRKMIDLVLRGHGVAGYDHPVFPNDPYRLVLERPQDIEKARVLLAEAGYPDGLDVELYVADKNAYMVIMALVYKEMAAKAGIRVKIRFVPAKNYWDAIWKKVPFCGSMWDERTADQILSEAYLSGAKWNDSFWSNPQFDQLLSDARKEQYPEKRKVFYQEAQRLVVEEGGTIIPFFENTIRVLRSDIDGIPVDLSRDNIDWARVSNCSI